MVSVNPTWTFTRISGTNTYHVRYVNDSTGEDKSLPDVTAIFVGDSYFLPFKNEHFTIKKGRNYDFTITHSNNIGEVVRTDAIKVVSPQDINDQQITGLAFDPISGNLTWDPMHFVDKALITYHVAIDGTEGFVSSKDFPLNDGYPLVYIGKYVDVRKNHVISVNAEDDSTTNWHNFGQQEIVYENLIFPAVIAESPDYKNPILGTDITITRGDFVIDGAFDANGDIKLVWENLTNKYGFGAYIKNYFGAARSLYKYAITVYYNGSTKVIPVSEDSVDTISNDYIEMTIPYNDVFGIASASSTFKVFSIHVDAVVGPHLPDSNRSAGLYKLKADESLLNIQTPSTN
jgi:hypothetical protein